MTDTNKTICCKEFEESIFTCIGENKTHISASYYNYYASQEIRFCPFCGKQLSDKKELETNEECL